ncbi:hypothetical protein PC111_g4026 [Phytophthora cactorum]|nr:hypothetical protein PC111_g4026 [Phytophthora cactorum]
MRFARLRGNPPAKSVLTDIRSRCKWLPELEKLCLRAVDRLEALHDEVAQCREDDPPRVKYIDTVVILLDRIIRRKPLLTRLARFHSVTLIIRGLHQDLDEVETGLGTSIEGNEWRDQWERDRTEQFSILEQLVQNTTDRQLLSEPDSAKRPTLDMAIEMIRELIKMQAKEKESDIMASIAGMTAIKSTEEAGTVPGEMVKTEVFCSWEADGSIVTTTVRTTTCTRTSASGELITEVTNTETEVTTETTETTEETVEEVTEETMEGTQGTITTTETTEVTEVTTIETITEEADAGSEDGMESSAALVASDTAAMSSLYARYAHESSSMESMTLSVDIDAAAQEIHRVCTGATSNEAALASLLLSKTVEQRYLIWCRYRILYKQNLSDLVKSKSDYGVLLKMLASPLEHAEAEILRKATKGLGTTEEWIYPVVMGRSNADIALLKKTFQEKYSDDLGKILNGDLSGSLKKVIETAMRGEVVEFDASVHTSAQSSADADRLYKAGEGRWGTDKKTFINILVLSPAQHVRNINRAYMVKHKSGLIGAIKAEFSGDTKRALLFLVRSVLEPMDLLAELFETALKRAGKNAYGLSAWVVRYFHLLERIFIAYRRLYRQDLRIRIRSVVRGEYRQLLLSVFDAAGVELGVFTPRSGLAGPTMSGAASRGSVMPMTQGQSRTQRTCKVSENTP